MGVGVGRGRGRGTRPGFRMLVGSVGVLGEEATV